MPETRYARNFDKDGNELAPTSYEVSDEQLYQEQLADEFNSVHVQAVAALKNWGSLTLAQKDAILKSLVKWAVWKDGWLKLGVL